MTLTEVPTTELVATAWAASIVGDIVATTLPDASKWADTGFVQVMPVGGTPHAYFALNRPVVSFDCWGNTPNSTSPPWAIPNALAHALLAAAQTSGDHLEQRFTLPRGIGDVRVMSVWPASSPLRVPDDDASYAHYTLDLNMVWVRS